MWSFQTFPLPFCSGFGGFPNSRQVLGLGPTANGNYGENQFTALYDNTKIGDRPLSLFPFYRLWKNVLWTSASCNGPCSYWKLWYKLTFRNTTIFKWIQWFKKHLQLTFRNKIFVLGAYSITSLQLFEQFKVNVLLGLTGSQYQPEPLGHNGKLPLHYGEYSASSSKKLFISAIWTLLL